MKVKSGHIPEEVIYIIAPARTISIKWDDVELEDGEEPPKEEVFPIFISDATNEKTLSTGRAWATHNKVPAREIRRKNEPFSGVHVVGLDVRLNGGRAWKCVIDDGKYYADLREDNLLDIMRTEGISKGGYLNGTFIWARIGTEMKLIRVGSEIHTAVAGASERRNMKPISRKALIPWHLYQQKMGDVYLYLGWCRGWEPKDYLDDWRESQSDPVLLRLQMWDQAVNGPRTWHLDEYKKKYGTDMSRPQNPTRLEIPYEAYRHHVWVKIDDWKEGKSLESQVKNLENSIHKKFSGAHALYDVKIDADIKVINDLGEFKAQWIFDKIREFATDQYLAHLRSQTEKRKDPVLFERARLKMAARTLKWGTIYEDGGEPDPSYDSWATWMLSTEPK